MKTDCDIIRDLLPLYVECAASEASQALIDEHLAECPACKEELARMQKPLPVKPEAEPDAPLKSVRRTLSRRMRRAVIFACVITAALLCVFIYFYTKETPVAFDDVNIATFEATENGRQIYWYVLLGKNEELTVNADGTWTHEISDEDAAKNANKKNGNVQLRQITSEHFEQPVFMAVRTSWLRKILPLGTNTITGTGYEKGTKVVFEFSDRIVTYLDGEIILTETFEPDINQNR